MPRCNGRRANKTIRNCSSIQRVPPARRTSRRSGCPSARGSGRSKPAVPRHCSRVVGRPVELLTVAGFDVVGQAGNADELMTLIRTTLPDVAVIDIRMPPAHTLARLRAAQAIRAECGSVINMLFPSTHSNPNTLSRDGVKRHGPVNAPVPPPEQDRPAELVALKLDRTRSTV